MKISELKKGSIEYIQDALQKVLIRFGVNVKVKASIETDSRDNEFLKVESSPFNTFPALYESVRVIGYGHLFEEEESLEINLKYEFSLFTLGTNGTEIGTAIFNVFPPKKTLMFRCLTTTVSFDSREKYYE